MPRTMAEDIALAMRRHAVEAEKKAKALQAQVLAYDTKLMTLEQRALAAERNMENAFMAIGVLASVVSNTNKNSRHAREKARWYLESVGLTPPNSLGASRPGSAKKKARKRKS